MAQRWRASPQAATETAPKPSAALVSPLANGALHGVVLGVRLLARPMAEWAGLAEPTFGSALFLEDGGFGMIAQVCSHCVEKLAKGREPAYASILGHVMAHELGHLLLAARNHLGAGLMHAPWYKKELERVAQGSLLFTSCEGEKMRRQVSARVDAEIAAGKPQ
jgi:hypothetical protein